jgi:hypothetical protein
MVFINIKSLFTSIFLVSTISEQSGGKASNNHRLIGCLTTLYLMSKFQPSMLVRHAATLQPYLSTKCNVSMMRTALLLYDFSID